MPLSVVSGRSIAEIAEGKGKKRVWHSNRSVQENVKAGATKGISSGRKSARSKGSNCRAADPRCSTRGRRVHRARPRPAIKKAKRAKRAERQERAKAKTSRCRTSCRRRSRPCAPRRRAATAGCTRSSSTAIASRRGLNMVTVRLLTRKGLDWTEKFPNVAAAVQKLRAESALIDGEIVVDDARGVSNFSVLQAALKDGRAATRFVYYVFDLLHLDGADLRRAAADRAQGGAGASWSATDKPASSATASISTRQARPFSAHACEMGLEGIVSKRADAPYRCGRIDTFIKTKCANAQEFVVGGYSPSTAMPNAVGALVVGYYEGGRARLCRAHRHRLHARGRAGFVEAAASALEVASSAVRRDPARGSAPPRRALGRAGDGDRSRISAVGPRTSWCARRPSRACARTSPPAKWCARCRLRSSEPSVDVRPPPERRRCAPAFGLPLQGEASSSRCPSRHAQAAQAKSATAKVRSSPKSKAPPSARVAAPEAAATAVRFTNPDRVYWADVGVTKQDLADYYRLGLGVDGAACDRSAARPGALPRRHQGRVLLSEARLGRTGRQDISRR